MSDHSNEILAALRNIEAWTNLQRKITKWGFLSFLPFILLMISIPFFASRYLDQTIKSHTERTAESRDWYDVSSASRKGNLKEALSIADELLLRNPRDFEGHYRKGELLLMLDDRAAALQSFRKAAELFPLPKYENAVKALESITPNGEP